jgi:hypothetical protein
MELLEGETLEATLRQGPMAIPALLETSLVLTDALADAHRAGIVHRDIKPANVFLTARGPKLLDFGIAKQERPVAGADTDTRTAHARPALTVEGASIGTLAYMSPEQLRGEEVDARTDVFSLGMVLFEMATGRRAFAGATVPLISAAILHETPPAPSTLRPGLTVRFDEIVLKALEKDRTLRYAQVADLRADLQRLKRDTDGTATAAVGREAPWPARRGRLLLTAGALLAIAAIGGGYLYSLYSRRPTPLTDKETVVLADFANTTGDPVFDGALRQRAGDSAPAVDVSRPDVGRAHPAAAAADGPARRREAHSGHRP